MRSLCVIAVLLFGVPAMAQDWCMPGATWAYHFEWLGAEYDVQYGFSHDTVIGGLDVKVAHGRRFGVMGGGDPFDQHWWEYTRIEDDVIYHGGSSGGWDTLYWFGEIGDRWWPPGASMDCPPHGMLEIVDTGHVVFGGLSLRKCEVVTLDSLGQAMIGPFPLTERIGTLPRYPEVHACNAIIDYFIPSFICYSDSEMIGLGTDPCVEGVGIPRSEAPATELRLAPNPARGSARVLLDQLKPGARLLLFDVRGRLVEQWSMYSPDLRLDLSRYAPGLYNVLLLAPSDRTLRSRVVID